MSRSLLPIDEARALVIQVAGSRRATEIVPVSAALDRVLAADVTAVGNVPRFPSSAMDGYAVRDLAAGVVLPVVGESRAGEPYPAELQPGQAVRISTGAMVPDAAAAVVRQEDATAQDRRVEIHVASEPGQNLRMPGEDMHTGQLVLSAGTRLRAPQLGAAVAAGAGELIVATQPQVSVLCTGDELRPPGAPLGPGQIHNSNAVVLQALVTHCGGLLTDASRAVGLLADDLEATEQALDRALSESDVVLVSGGVSVGPHDHVKPALSRLGVTEHFWGVALQPGKPTWFGSRGEKLVFALPGNPVSAAVTFSLFARPALDALLGAQPEQPPLPEARLGREVRRNPERDQALRVRFEMRDGVPVVLPAGAQGSHVFTTLLSADCLAIVPRGRGMLEAGRPVKLELLPG
ncbi:MAG TPA: gephyrin-like molybdotransferase Glp [Solirubrobacteraceae bacterium]|jgi:molybdopterin molybdotransferase|nr:gephyrin-like molybdotransferase Glp [Solirubrobacteraceae bacterium]